MTSRHRSRPAGRVPVPANELFVLREPRLTRETCERLLEFNRAWQQRDLLAFLRFRHDWQEANPGKTFHGLCAEVDSVTGKMRPLSEQRAWTWGDGRGLGIWAALLIKGRIADRNDTLSLSSGTRRTVNLRQEFEDYCDFLFTCLAERYEACGGTFPFMADIETNRPAKDPRNFVPGPGEVSASDIFCLTAMFQYAMLRRNTRSLEIGMDLLTKCADAARTGSYPAAEEKRGHRFQGSPMVTVGAIVDILKSIAVLETRGESAYSSLKPTLVGHARDMVDYILTNHYDPVRQFFWEENDAGGKPFINERGQLICDPGHTAEACGFFAELCSFLPEQETGARWRWRRDTILAAILELNHLVTRLGFSDRGVMFKNIDLLTGRGVADTSGGGAAINKPTAPWWNVREHCAASLKLYELARDPRCLEGYLKSQNASYIHYPNLNIGGLMVQTLDPFTLEPMNVHPATGNIDPMHSTRAREREIEALERIAAHLDG